MQYEEAMKVNDFGNKKLKLYLLNTLNNGINTINVPQTELASIEGSTEESLKNTEEQNKWIKEEKRKYKKEKKKFFPFFIGSIKERKLNHTFINSKLIIEQVSEEIYRKKIANFDGTSSFLGISRIVFNRNFDTGYLSYGFFCGPSCAWSDNIEIKKIDGKWKITEKFSGGIAQRNIKSKTENNTENWKWKSKPNEKDANANGKLWLNEIQNTTGNSV